VSEKLTILLLHFAIALTLSVIITPFTRFVGARLGAFDEQGERKVHLGAIPRVGGIAICLSFLVSVFILHFLFGLPQAYLTLDRKTGLFLAGGLIVFGIGLFDDFHPIGHRVKFCFQVFGSSIAYLGGVHITYLFGVDIGGAHAVASYAVTIFWFVLFINALNLIDGLDGLAGGIAFFTSTVMAIISYWRGDFSSAFLFGALAGTCLGFLRYNFNPASIFMGDGGSYFLGYIIAGISILSSSKSQVGATILIPLLALGVPIFDTILAPIRRFLIGKRMFRPDTGHVHHRLVSMGFSTKKAVWIIYAASLVLCVFSLFLVNLHNQTVGIFLASLASVVFLFLKKLGYLQHLDADRIYGWIKDVSDEAGLSRERRSFLNLQLAICDSKDLEELWKNTCRALMMLDFDMSKIKVANQANRGDRNPDQPAGHTDLGIPGISLPKRELDNVGEADHDVEWTWTYNGFDPNRYVCQECMFKLELPLLDDQNNNLGTLWLVKDLKRNSFSHYTLRRVEHLRRSVTRTLKTLGQ